MLEEQDTYDAERAAWTARFVARMVAYTQGRTELTPDEVAEYATDAAKEVWHDRDQYDSPEEAAETDVSYWEPG